MTSGTLSSPLFFYLLSSSKKYCTILYSFPAIIVQYFLQNVNGISHISQKGVFEIEFRDNLRVLRLEKGFTQKELAELVGIDQSTISDYEAGRSEPIISVAMKLAKMFNMTVEELYSGRAEE